MAKKLFGGNRCPDSVSAELIVAVCCVGVIAMWAPVARAQLILSAVAVLAVWFKPPDKPDK
jgi:hypothetical protein